MIDWAAAVFAIFMTYPPSSASDPTSGLLPAYNDVYANWSNAGLVGIGGIPTRSTQCGATVSPSGLTPPVANDDADKINAAITACTAGQVVQLAAGTFQISQSEYIALNKGVTLRGNGSCSNGSSPYCNTVINVRDGAIANWTISPTPSVAGSNCGVTSASVSTCSAATGAILVSPSANYDWGWGGCILGATPTSCGTTLTADAAQGAYSVTVTSTTNFSVGMFVLIDENPQVSNIANPVGNGQAAIPASSDFLSTSGSPATMRLAGTIDAPTTYSLNPNRVNAEIHKITAINAGTKTLTFDTPLTMAFRQTGSHDARVYWPTTQGGAANPFLQQAGVENLSITRPAFGGVTFEFCAYCWMKGVEVSGWINGGFNIAYSIRTQVENSYIHDGYDLENNGAEYPFAIDAASIESLVQNNIVVRGGKGMVGRASGANVVAYNYIDDTFYQASVIGDYWRDMGLNGSHYGGTHHWLFEGNWAPSCDNDETHGNAIYHTYFRNDCTAYRTPFTDPSTGFSVNDLTGLGYTDIRLASSLTASFSGGTWTFVAVAQPDSNSTGVPVISGSGQAIGVTGVTGTGASLINGRQTLSAFTDNLHFSFQIVAASNAFTAGAQTGSIAFAGGQSPGPLRAAGQMGYDYWMAFVGNTMGTSGQTTAGNGWSYSCSSTFNTGSGDKCVWLLGYTLGEWNYAPDPNLNGTNTPRFFFQHSNYDYYNNAIVDRQAGYSTTLTNSFFLSGAPSFFSAGSGYPWPWVTPTGGSPIATGPAGCGGTCSALPAKARYDAGTPFVQP